MAYDWLNHKALRIVKGIGKLPTDTNSAENDPVVFNLLSEPVALTMDGWSPQIAALKSGGVWADSPISDGRSLIAAPVGNVTEKMTFIITDSTFLGVQRHLLALNDMALDCRASWEGQAQIDPVYLAWWAGCGKGEQYALLYNIDVTTEYLSADKPTIRVNLTLEREPYWRGLPPGANPKLWTFYVNNQQIGTNKTLADATLVTGSDHLVTQTIQNKFEWTPTAVGLQVTPISQNYIDIPKNLIPGDAPALIEVNIISTQSNYGDVFISRSSKKHNNAIGHDGVTRSQALILNHGDANATSYTKTLGTSTSGVKSNGSSTNYYYGSRTSTGIDANFLIASLWSGGSANSIRLDRQLLRGTYAIFVRACNNSSSPVLTDMSMRVTAYEYDTTVGSTGFLNTQTLSAINVPVIGAGGIRPLSYMGSLTIPFSTKSTQSLLGYGIQIEETNPNLVIQVEQKVNVATANRVFEISDLILMPIDECMIQAALSSTQVGSIVTIDNTGFLSRSDFQPVCAAYTNQGDIKTGGVYQELRGGDITLLPNVDQRLYFLSDAYVSSVSGFSLLNETFDVRLNIVPRWAGIRDV